MVIRDPESAGTFLPVDSAVTPSSEKLRNAARLAGRILVTVGVLVFVWYTISFFSLFVG